MALSSFLSGPQLPGPADYQREAQQDVARQQAQQLALQSTRDDQENKRRSLAVSMLNGIAREQDPAKQAALYSTLKPMAERYDPTLKLPDQYDPLLTSALGASQVSPREFFDTQKPNLPQGYRMNPQTGQAEIIPGVDPSFGKKADPYSMPMPVQTPDGQTTFATKQQVADNPTGYKPAPQPGQGFGRENQLRDEFNTLTKDFRTVQDAYSKITSTSDTGAGDMSMLYAYVKLLDPGSVVRESEFASAAASGSFGDRVAGAVKSVVSGGRLPPDLRRQFTDEAARIYAGQKTGYDRTRQTYTGIAERNNLSPDNVITDYAQPATGGPQVGTEEDGYVFLGGNPAEPTAWKAKR